MTTKNPLGDIAKVFEGLDDVALQSLFDQTDAELTLRGTSRVHNVFMSLEAMLRIIGHPKKDESTCVTLRNRDGQLIGVRVTLPYNMNYFIANMAVWDPVLKVLAANCPEFDFRIQLDPEVCQARVGFAVPGLKTVPGIPEVPDSKEAGPPSLTTVLAAFKNLKDEVEEPSTLPDTRGPVE